MTVEKFVQNDEMLQLLAALQADCRDKEFSDIVDEAGHQYIDLVMEGGGVLGVALVGYTYVLEALGLRFLGIGGTSAGSINALLLAALGAPAERKSEKLVQLLATLPLKEFVDGDSDVQDFIEVLLASGGKLSFKMAFKGAQVLDTLMGDLGLNPGRRFLGYITEQLAQAGINTTLELRQRLATLPPGLRTRAGEPLDAASVTPKLAIVAADVSTETKVEFPKMAPLYWPHVDDINPALYVRASMSIPYFFQPFVIKRIPKGAAAEAAWRELASWEGKTPGKALFVDGGVMSNFPIDLFHAKNQLPRAPTFGAKLGSDRRTVHQIDSPFNLGGAIFNAARHCLDFDFIARNPDYRQLVTHIDTGPHDWLNFDMKQSEQVQLFMCGARAAAEFLRAFDWAKYKRTRAGLLQAAKAAA